MKLIDLLVQELPKRGGCPEGVNRIGQDYDRQLRPDFGFSFRLGNLSDDHRCHGVASSELDDSFFVTKEQYEAALAASKQPTWGGEGLPPVGTECEWLASGDHDWMRVKVLAYHEDEVWLQPLNGAQSFTVGNPDDFRPIRTEAERKREDATAEMSASIAKYTDMTFLEAIYEAVAAGEIKAFKLAD